MLSLYLQTLKDYKIFETVDGSFISISKAERFYFLPSGVPSEGIICLLGTVIVLKHPGLYINFCRLLG